MTTTQNNKTSGRPLTVALLKHLSEGAKVTDAGFDPDGLLRGKQRGSLIARRRQGRETVEFYLRMRAGGEDRLHRIGYFAAGKRKPDLTVDGLMLTEAREKALALALQYADEGASFKGKRLAEEDAVRAEQAGRAAAEAQLQADAVGTGSLGELLKLYVGDLRKRGRASAREVENKFRLHIEENQPDLWKKPARDVSKDDVKQVLNKMLDAGIGRGRNLMRSYLSTAFTFGLRLDDDEAYADEAARFRLDKHPVAGIKRKGELDRAGQRALSASEAGAYLRALDGMADGPIKAFLELNLRLGGQRVSQLLRARWRDVRDDVLWLRDPKGRGEPRDHLVPVTGRARAIIRAQPRFGGLITDPTSDRPTEFEFIFTHNGKQPVVVSTVSKAVRELADGMVRAKVVQTTFGASDLRRTCETLLAGLRVSKDIRAELLSHGRSGVVSKHYDRHEYLPEKRQALAKWNRALDKWKAEASGDAT